MKACKFDWNEVYRILDSLNQTGQATSDSLYRDTVNHYYELAHRKSDPTAIVITGTSNDTGAHYSIKHVVITDECWIIQ